MKLTEEGSKDIIESWFERDVRTTNALVALINELASYEHDYGTIVYAVAAVAVQAAKVMDRQPCGGITGFQAGAVFWTFWQRWLREDGPARIIKYEDMLFPQYERHFTQRTISAGTWKWLQEQAKRHSDTVTDAHPDVMAHWTRIVSGVVPFGYAAEDDA